ncbi:hypothetical protein G7K_2472-t1 [Saitoella complicata NRRL Y-17804]|uniref:Uncharacterized protein n=1 Tax=Saitoella complicata (strain BCRC 22490 / CBS 7301 / JCM 7358 / NBRC 10748 / NRRL Y-17804) TaxID=698492 RepID=A0A0E9NEM2_SAICN|nr:hypothetical protein G7K_2472-t1 [Saitoella complicata NRRL Y-17804]
MQTQTIVLPSSTPLDVVPTKPDSEELLSQAHDGTDADAQTYFEYKTINYAKAKQKDRACRQSGCPELSIRKAAIVHLARILICEFEAASNNQQQQLRWSFLFTLFPLGNEDKNVQYELVGRILGKDMAEDVNDIVQCTNCKAWAHHDCVLADSKVGKKKLSEKPHQKLRGG